MAGGIAQRRLGDEVPAGTELRVFPYRLTRDARAAAFHHRPIFRFEHDRTLTRVQVMRTHTEFALAGRIRLYPPLIRKYDLKVAVLDVDVIRQVVDDRPQQVALARQCFLGLAVFGYVAGDA